jgi:hypothetical protein
MRFRTFAAFVVGFYLGGLVLATLLGMSHGGGFEESLIDGCKWPWWCIQYVRFLMGPEQVNPC